MKRLIIKSKLIKKIFPLIVFALCFSSCNKWLDVDLVNTVDEKKLFSTEQGFVDALAGAYNQLSASGLYGSRLSYEFLDVLAQYYSYTNIGEAYRPIRDYDYLNASVRSQIDAIWSDLYEVIAATNNIIAWEKQTGDVMRPEIRKQVLGEALALRAFIHFDLLRMFSEDIKFNHEARGIPYNKQFGVALPPSYKTAECFQLALNDLLQAKENLDGVDPVESTVPYTLADKNAADKFVARINKYTVRAIMARLYLAKGDKENAAKYAREVIDSRKFRLLNFPASVDVDEGSRDILFSDEHIFSIRNSNIPSSSLGLHFSVSSGGVTTPTKLPFADASSIYNANADDARYLLWFDGGNLNKFVRGNANTFFPKIPLIKLSEMYLILAESLYDTDRNACLEFINTLRRSRIRNATDLFYISRENIFEEIKREFVGEGQLFFAYKRLNKAIANNSGTGDIPPSNSIFVLPIPQKEIETGFRDTP